MKYYFALAAALAALALALLPSLTAQDQPTRLVIVDSVRLFDAHPQGGDVAELMRERDAELGELRQELETLVARIRASGQEAGLEDRQRYELLSRTLEEANMRWLEEINAAAAPISRSIDEVIRTVAEENNYSIVIDGVVAASSGLIVYAESGLDITDTVIERLR